MGAGHPGRRLVDVWSTSKGPTALCAHILADRGLLDFDAPVAAYWPEFAAAGKEKVLVRHLLSHRSGLSGVGTERGAGEEVLREVFRGVDGADRERFTELLHQIDDAARAAAVSR